jgi:hypothetical protein
MNQPNKMTITKDDYWSIELGDRTQRTKISWVFGGNLPRKRWTQTLPQQDAMFPLQSPRM